MTEPVKTILAELSERLRRTYGSRLTCIVLFGSQARGDAQPGSDIDVLVVLRVEVDSGEEIARTGAIASEVSLRNDVVISCVFVSEERFGIEESPFLLNVRREGVPV